MSPLSPVSISPNQYMKQLEPYDTAKLLAGINWMSRRLEQLNQGLISQTMYERIGQIKVRASINVSHHGLATMAMYAIRQSRQAGTGDPTGPDIARLSSNLYAIEDKWIRDRKMDDPLMALVRVANAQFPYQESYGHLIPRYLSILEANPITPKIDINDAFVKRTGLTIEDFIGIGFIFYSGLSLRNAIGLDYFKKSELQDSALKPLLTEEKLQLFVKATSLSLSEFREHRYEEERQADDNGPYVFNPLVAFPLVRLGNGIITAPVPRLIIHRISKGIYYDLLEAFSTPAYNPFTEWFGFALEEYLGKLLKATLGTDKVFHETSYGKRLPTPDWVGVDSELAVALESRTSRLPKLLKTTADAEEVKRAIHRVITDPGTKLATKVASLQSGETPLPVSQVTRFLPVVVTLEEWYPGGLTSVFVRSQMAENGLADFPLEITSVADLEWLLAWQEVERPLGILQAKIDEPGAAEISLGHYLAKRATDKGLKFPSSRFLADRFDEFFKHNGFPSSSDAIASTQGNLGTEGTSKNGDGSGDVKL